MKDALSEQKQMYEEKIRTLERQVQREQFSREKEVKSAEASAQNYKALYEMASKCAHLPGIPDDT
jgi:hypothetical protein